MIPLKRTLELCVSTRTPNLNIHTCTFRPYRYLQRFPMGIFFPTVIRLVAFAAASSVMPLRITKSVPVRVKRQTQPAIALRDLAHATPYYAIQ